MKRIVMLAAALVLVAPLHAQNVATVNGKAITQANVDQFVKLLVGRGATDSPEIRNQIKEELINRQVMVQAAEAAGIPKDPTVSIELELARQGILVQALMADYLKNNPITEEAVKAEYEKLKKAESDKFEYNVRHILVEDEKTANDIQEKLKNKSAKFEDLAKQSKDTGSAAKGGDLGWAPDTNYVEPFAKAVAATKKGQLADKPVQSQFGWHVIEVVDIRPVEFPPLDQVRKELEQMMREQALAAYQAQLRSKAKIQ
ncbi:peptidylprolyl isomerase [Zwartia sp.]|uniref:peptidylprolyl isomerase n=1 Tax=Zwartia sp. TaxID=2978004 RepID=UPI00272051A1|nr:peptidylprolyl isomerase [Zwartia sp.]MDO9023406.1 peptidylprolyl isomerase [Zwartia sp.]